MPEEIITATSKKSFDQFSYINELIEYLGLQGLNPYELKKERQFTDRAGSSRVRDKVQESTVNQLISYEPHNPDQHGLDLLVLSDDSEANSRLRDDPHYFINVPYLSLFEGSLTITVRDQGLNDTYDWPSITCNLRNIALAGDNNNKKYQQHSTASQIQAYSQQ